MKGARRLETSPELRLSSTRAVRRHGGVEIPIATPASLAPALGDVIACRRSRRDFGCEPVAADVLAALLDAGYGVTGALESPDDHPPALRSGGSVRRRVVPAGALRGSPTGRRTRTWALPLRSAFPVPRGRAAGPDRGGSRGTVHVPRDRVLVRCASARRCDLRAYTVQVRPARLPLCSPRGGSRRLEHRPRSDRPRPGRGPARRLLRPPRRRLSRTRRCQRIDALRDRGRTGADVIAGRHSRDLRSVRSPASALFVLLAGGASR